MSFVLLPKNFKGFLKLQDSLKVEQIFLFDPPAGPSLNRIPKDFEKALKAGGDFTRLADNKYKRYKISKLVSTDSIISRSSIAQQLENSCGYGPFIML